MKQKNRRFGTISLYPTQEIDPRYQKIIENLEKQEKILSEFSNPIEYDVALEHLTLYSFERILEDENFTQSYYQQIAKIYSRIARAQKRLCILQQEHNDIEYQHYQQTNKKLEKFIQNVKSKIEKIEKLNLSRSQKYRLKKQETEKAKIEIQKFI